MVTKERISMIELHTHTHTQLSAKNTNKNEITRGDYALKYIH